MLDTRRNSHNSHPPLGRRGRRIALLVVGITLLAAGAIGASMTGLSWNNAGGGTAATAANWSPAQIPTSADDLTFNLNNTYTVTYNSSTPSSRTHTYKRGTVTLSATNPHTVSNGITVGDVSGDVAIATLTTGTITSNALVVVGDASGSTGTLNISDDDANLILATSAGDVIVGSNGAGALSITGGGLVQVSDRFQAGSNNASTATVTVSGATVLPITRSTLEVNGTGSTHAIGGGGDVTMNVSSGGLADFAGNVNVGQGAASTTTVTIGGSGGFSDASLSVGGNLTIAGNQAAGTSGGVGTVNVNANGSLTVGGTLSVAADPDGGTGTLHLSNGGAITTNSFAGGAGATLDLDGGTLDIDGGTFTWTNPVTDLAIGAVASPLVTLRNGAAGTLQDNAGNRALTVGSGASVSIADFDVRNGSSLTIPSGGVVLGETGVCNGGMIINGPGSTMTMQPSEIITVGQSGIGRFEAEQGASVTLPNVFIAQNPGSDGLVLIEGAGTTADLQKVWVGGSSGAAGGSGVFMVNGGALCNVTGPATNTVKVWPTGRLTVTNATLTVADTVYMDGAAILQGAAINADVFRVSTDIAGDGTINANVVIAASIASITASGGDLTLGRSTNLNGFLSFGTLDVSDQTVTLLDGDPTGVNQVTLGGGTLKIPNGGIIASGDSLFGFGIVDADINNFGKIKGAATGLAFKGIVSGVGQGFTGPVTRFINGGGFAGSGTISSPIFGDATSSFTPTGTLTMGNSGSVTGINIDGALNVDATTVTLLDQDAAELAGATTLSGFFGGTLTAANGILLQNGGSITGKGTVNAEFDGEAGSSIVANGALAIGKSTESFGFETNGALNVGASSVTLRSLDNVRLGRSTTIAGGTLTHTGSGSFLLEAGDSLSGSGAVSDPVRMEVGCVITATGPLTMGSAASNSGFLGVGGTLHVNANAVTLLVGNIASLPSLTTIAGGSLSSPVDLLITSGKTLRGYGQITPWLLNEGRIEPGDPIGTLTLTDGLFNTVTSTIAVQIGGAGAQANDADPARAGASAAKNGAVVWDQIVVADSAALDGTLRVAQLPGLVVAAGDSFPILTCSSRSGTFASIVFDDPYLDNMFDVVYTPTAVVLVARATTGVDLPPVGDPSDGIPDDGVIAGANPAAFGLRVVASNPFTAATGTAFEYDVPASGSSVSLAIFDASGRLVTRLVDAPRSAGTHAAAWRGGEMNLLSSGVYFLRMDAGSFHATKRLVMIR